MLVRSASWILDLVDQVWGLRRGEESWGWLEGGQRGTEKWSPTHHNNIKQSPSHLLQVPIVFGGADYQKLLPAGSFINALDFPSPEGVFCYPFTWMPKNCWLDEPKGGCKLDGKADKLSTPIFYFQSFRISQVNWIDWILKLNFSKRHRPLFDHFSFLSRTVFFAALWFLFISTVGALVVVTV